VLPNRRSPWAAIAFTTVLALGLIVVVRTQSESSIVAALSGTTALLLLAVFTIVNVCVLILRRDPHSGHFRAPTVVPVLGAICCAYLLGPWARLEADMIQYKIAAGLLGIGIVLWGLTMLLYKPEGGRFRDIEHLGD
jgi:amino acid transporter